MGFNLAMVYSLIIHTAHIKMVLDSFGNSRERIVDEGEFSVSICGRDMATVWIGWHSGMTDNSK